MRNQIPAAIPYFLINQLLTPIITAITLRQEVWWRGWENLSKLGRNPSRTQEYKVGEEVELRA
jgi:hypothetical protein